MRRGRQSSSLSWIGSCSKNGRVMVYLAGGPCLLVVGEGHEELVGVLALLDVLAGE